MTGFETDDVGPWINKDPNAILDYTQNWAVAGSSWLGTDTISSATWTVPSGLVQESTNHTNTTATIWLSGGVAGVTYTVTCEIVTAGGRKDDRSFRVICAER